MVRNHIVYPLKCLCPKCMPILNSCFTSFHTLGTSGRITVALTGYLAVGDPEMLTPRQLSCNPKRTQNNPRRGPTPPKTLNAIQVY